MLDYRTIVEMVQRDPLAVLGFLVCGLSGRPLVPDVTKAAWGRRTHPLNSRHDFYGASRLLRNCSRFGWSASLPVRNLGDPFGWDRSVGCGTVSPRSLKVDAALRNALRRWLQEQQPARRHHCHPCRQEERQAHAVNFPELPRDHARQQSRDTGHEEVHA